MVKGDLLASLGLYRAAEREYDRALRVQGRDLYALDELLQRFERIGAMNKALRVSGAIIVQEREQGVPMTLASFRRLYPTYYWGEINQAAEEMDLDPNLILAIMRQESAFDEAAMSRAGARGLMQIMPPTFEEIRRRNPAITGRINHPRWNIAAGIWYDRQNFVAWEAVQPLIEQLKFMFGSYNAGRSSIRRARAVAVELGLDGTVWESITQALPEVTGRRSSETLMYVDRIFGIKQVLR